MVPPKIYSFPKNLMIPSKTNPTGEMNPEQEQKAASRTPQRRDSGKGGVGCS